MFSLNLSSKGTEQLTAMINQNPGLLLHIPQARELITFHRLSESTEVDQIKDGPAVHDHTVTHNLNSLGHGLAQHRPMAIFGPLSGIGYIRMNAAKLKLLIIGPRSENELFTAYVSGFKPENVTAIDLISYSKLIELGDMHNLPYEDNRFDLIVAGWVLAYSNDNKRAAAEMLRVCKPQGHIAIGCVAEPMQDDLAEQIEMAVGGLQLTSDDPERPGMTKTVSRYFTSEQILRLFDPQIDALIYREDPHPTMRDMRADLVTIFRVL